MLTDMTVEKTKVRGLSAREVYTAGYHLCYHWSEKITNRPARRSRFEKGGWRLTSITCGYCGG
jgi:hypothetical protein